MTTRNYKEFQRKIITTLDDVSSLREEYLVAHHLEPQTKMKVFGTENHYVQDQLVDTIVYLSSDYDPLTVQIRSLWPVTSTSASGPVLNPSKPIITLSAPILLKINSFWSRSSSSDSKNLEGAIL